MRTDSKSSGSKYFGSDYYSRIKDSIRFFYPFKESTRAGEFRSDLRIVYHRLRFGWIGIFKFSDSRLQTDSGALVLNRAVFRIALR